MLTTIDCPSRSQYNAACSLPRVCGQRGFISLEGGELQKENNKPEAKEALHNKRGEKEKKLGIRL